MKEEEFRFGSRLRVFPRDQTSLFLHVDRDDEIAVAVPAALDFDLALFLARTDFAQTAPPQTQSGPRPNPWLLLEVEASQGQDARR